MIDWAHVAELYADFGADGFAEVLDVFTSEVTDGLGQLDTAQTPDQHRVAFHFLKGAALNLGIQDIAVLCATGEANAADAKICGAAKEQVLILFPSRCAVLAQQWRQRVSAIQ
jgi:HPt (histidine-containing phosphotransfer) domain-containing protein